MTQQEFERFTKAAPASLTDAELEEFAVRADVWQKSLEGSTDYDEQLDSVYMDKRNAALLEEIGNRIRAGQFCSSLTT